MWWKKLYFASRKEIGSSRRKYKLDSLLVTAGALLWLGAVALAARATEQSFLLLVTLAVIVPFLLWNGIMGFVVYLHHTSPKIAWFRNRQEWQRHRAYLTSTACVRFPFGIDRLMHSIMEHNAHHLNPRIPMFKLRAAQRVLQREVSGSLRVPAERPVVHGLRAALQALRLHQPCMAGLPRSGDGARPH